jgi:DNA-directed RNA polymerase specialized sigma24 family protein
VARARAGDPRAFRVLYHVAFRLTWAFTYRSVGDAARAEQLTARSLRRTFASLASYDGGTSFGGWVIRHAEAVLRERKRDACPTIVRRTEERS